MGCQQSVPTDVDSFFVPAKSPSVAGSANISGTRKACIDQAANEKSNNEQSTVTTAVSTATTVSTASLRTARTVNSASSVSLGVDEDVSYLLPKVDYNGHLLTEEIVRRTSSILQCSSLSIGKGTKTFELQVSIV